MIKLIGTSARQFAQNYSCGTYSAGSFGACEETSSNLANTGYDILLPIFLGVSLMIASIILLVKRTLRRRAQAKTSFRLPSN